MPLFNTKCKGDMDSTNSTVATTTTTTTDAMMYRTHDNRRIQNSLSKSKFENEPNTIDLKQTRFDYVNEMSITEPQETQNNYFTGYPVNI